MRHPGFAGEQDAHWIWHRASIPEEVYDCSLDGARNDIDPADV
jgi:hypothetical protein